MTRSIFRPVAPLMLMLAVVPAVPASASAGERALVVVGAEPGALRAAERSVTAAGGEIEHRLAIVGGFSARVPARAIAGLRAAPGVRSVARDQPIRLSSVAQAPAEPNLIDAPPPLIPVGPADQVADAVIDEAAEDAAAGASVAPTPVGLEAPLAPDPAATGLVLDDAAARARASAAVVRGGAGLDEARTGAGVDVALIDSGVVGLPALAGGGRLVRGPDYSEDAGNPDLNGLDAFGHGTHMAGIIAGDDPETGFTGVAPGARLVSVKVAGADGLTSLVRILLAFDWVREHRAAAGLRIRVLNLSLGVESVRPYTREPLAYAVERLWRSGVTVVAAAGNQADGTGELDLPAADPFVLAVGATDTAGTADPADDSVAAFSSSDATRNPDVVAPGTSVVSLRVAGSTLDEEFPAARIGETFFRGSGTSQATAVVSGAVARLLEARPTLTPDQVKALRRGSAAGTGAVPAREGAGRIDAGAALAAATPASAAAAQHFTPARLDLVTLWADLAAEAAGTAPQVGAGENGWTGRRWSGRRWSGRRWSGRRWSGGTYGQ